jgi:hypothetical protein
MKKSKILELVIKSIPDPILMSDIDIDSEEFAIRFRWRNSIFRVTDCLSVDSIQGSFLVSDSLAKLLETLLKKSNTIA